MSAKNWFVVLFCLSIVFGLMSRPTGWMQKPPGGWMHQPEILRIFPCNCKMSKPPTPLSGPRSLVAVEVLRLHACNSLSHLIQRCFETMTLLNMLCFLCFFYVFFFLWFGSGTWVLCCLSPFMKILPTCTCLAVMLSISYYQNTSLYVADWGEEEKRHKGVESSRAASLCTSARRGFTNVYFTFL